jgi:hypothetical protein
MQLHLPYIVYKRPNEGRRLASKLQATSFAACACMYDDMVCMTTTTAATCTRTCDSIIVSIVVAILTVHQTEKSIGADYERTNKCTKMHEIRILGESLKAL